MFDQRKSKSPSLHSSREGLRDWIGKNAISGLCPFNLWHYTVLQVGVWHEQHGISFARNFTESLQEIVESLQNKTLVVTTIRVSFHTIPVVLVACFKGHCNLLPLTGIGIWELNCWIYSGLGIFSFETCEEEIRFIRSFLQPEDALMNIQFRWGFWA